MKNVLTKEKTLLDSLGTHGGGTTGQKAFLTANIGGALAGKKIDPAELAEKRANVAREISKFQDEESAKIRYVCVWCICVYCFVYVFRLRSL
jgi:hypothetical protein